MKKIIGFLFLFSAFLTWILVLDLRGQLPQWIMTSAHLPFRCVLAGGFGGVMYCLRGVYLNVCAKKNWDNSWQPWYYIRPFVSLLSGGLSFLFLKAGLLVLEANAPSDASQLGFLALAFIAGLNVDKFVAKVEDIAQAAWGIEKTRVAKDVSNDQK